MYYAVDTYYFDRAAKTVCVGFSDWTSADYDVLVTDEYDRADAYQSGEFYKRELPCILRVLDQITLQAGDLILIDGYVYLDDHQKPGLGAHLYQHFDRRYPVIGVAKTAFKGIEMLRRAVLRGKSKQPLYITAAGAGLDWAAENIQAMAGHYRIPELLKKLDQLTRINPF